jgi:hypothetical protein
MIACFGFFCQPREKLEKQKAAAPQMRGGWVPLGVRLNGGM